MKLDTISETGLAVDRCLLPRIKWNEMVVVNGRIRKRPAANYSAPALDKGLDVLELIAASSEPLMLTTIAEQLGRTKPELFRVVMRLYERGYLLRDSAGCYRISTKLFEIGSKHASVQGLVERAMPHMRRLTHRLGESCHLNIVVQNRMLVAARAECDADIALAVRVGASFELHSRNTGRLALTYLPVERLEAYWRQARQSAPSIKRWAKEAESMRHDGYLNADSTVTVGVRDCAAPVLGTNGQLIAVLCVSHIMRIGEFSQSNDIPRAVVACAKQIAEEFGPSSDGATNGWSVDS